MTPIQVSDMNHNLKELKGKCKGVNASTEDKGAMEKSEGQSS